MEILCCEGDIGYIKGWGTLHVLEIEERRGEGNKVCIHRGKRSAQKGANRRRLWSNIYNFAALESISSQKSSAVE